MAVEFSDNSTDAIAWGSDSSIDDFTAFTFWAWIYPLGYGTPDYFMFFKGSFAGGNKTLKFGTTNGRIGFEITRATTDSTCVSSTTYPINSWYFLAATYDENGGTAGTTINTYKGTLSAAVTENSYSSRIQGSGATGADAAQDAYCPNYSGGSEGFYGRIACFGYINRYLSLGELRSLQWRPRNVSGTRIFSHLNGTGAQYDWSGYKNHSTAEVGSLTHAPHVPLPYSWGHSQKMEPQVAAAVGISIPVVQHHRRIQGVFQ